MSYPPHLYGDPHIYKGVLIFLKIEGLGGPIFWGFLYLRDTRSTVGSSMSTIAFLQMNALRYSLYSRAFSSTLQKRLALWISFICLMQPLLVLNRHSSCSASRNSNAKEMATFTSPTPSETVFSKIIKKDIPADIIHEDDKVFDCVDKSIS